MKKAPFSVALLYFLKVISQPFKITNRICRFCNILDRMTDNFFKGVFIHIRFFVIVIKVLRGSCGRCSGGGLMAVCAEV